MNELLDCGLIEEEASMWQGTSAVKIYSQDALLGSCCGESSKSHSTLIQNTDRYFRILVMKVKTNHKLPS